MSKEEVRFCANCMYWDIERDKHPCKDCIDWEFWEPKKEKSCFDCKHKWIPLSKYPCKGCKDRKFWEPEEEKPKEEEERSCMNCKFFGVPWFDEPCDSCDINYIKWQPKEEKSKEEKECKDCRHSTIGCECSEPCKNHDRWQPKEEKEEEKEKEKISMADICGKVVSEKERHKYQEVSFLRWPYGADTVHKPSHYAKGRRFEPKDVIADWELGFNLGNALKYISRCGRKGDPIEDLQKAKEFIDFEISEYKKSRDKKEFENFVKTHKDEIKEALKKMEDDLK